jgi:hypothetical protein
MDAASFWGTSRSGDESTGENRFEERRLTLDLASNSPKKNIDGVDQTNQFSRRTEGGLMPFDMDVPVSYGSVTTGGVATLQIGMTDLSTGAIVSGNGMEGIVEEGGPDSSEPTKKSSAMQPIETERVPCPRLCGAVFGRGNGGLVTFHNGEVKKMWSWYQRTENVRVPQLPTDLMTAREESMRQALNADSTGSTHPLGTEDEASKNDPGNTKQSPRTLKELLSMLAAAKDAQWGDDVASDGSDSDDILSGGGNFFEDDSLGSNSSDDDFEEEGLGSAQTEDLYRRYFGGQDTLKGATKASQSPSRSVPPPSPASPSRRSKQLHPIAGPSSDMLSPVVRLTRKYDQDILGHQSVGLAKGWKLGPWDTNTVAYSDVTFSYRGDETKTEAILADDDPLLPEGKFTMPSVQLPFFCT